MFLVYNENMNWNLITNIILISSFIVLGIFVVLAIYEWITRGSIKKVDRELRWLPVPLALMAATYLIFDKVLILNTRPDGSGEPSFPSTHVMAVATIFFLVTMILPKYIKSKVARVVLEIIMVALISITCSGRVLANKHWISDVLAALVFAFIFTLIYHLILKYVRKSK